jgi:uncharacterized protein YcfJ
MRTQHKYTMAKKEHEMKQSVKLCLSVIFLGAAAGAQAIDFEDHARVISVTPQVEKFNQPRQECKTEYVQTQTQRPQQRGVAGSILGGIAGGLIGSQVGGGNGRTAATAVGAVTGAIVGDRMENSDNDGGTTITEQPVRHCRTVDHWETRNSGYNVVYEYRGRTYSSMMPYDPGERVKLNVSITQNTLLVI